ncbi:MAG: phenylacetaldoxime dehydratase family protein [Pseudomonadota bacterium]
MKKSKPENFEPPYDAYTSVYPAEQVDITLAMVGVQFKPDDDAEATKLLDEITNSMDAGAQSPLHVERAREFDAFGYVNDILLGYWRHEADHAAWRESPDVLAWRKTPRSGAVGLWFEAFTAPTDNLDPNYSLEDIQWGSGRHTEQKWERYHSYFGSMRDRIPKGHSGELDPEDRELMDRARADSFKKRLTVTAPDGLCFIRGAFGWEQATDEEQASFIEDMFPVYKTGAHYLRDHPKETNCISLRFSSETENGLRNGVQHESLGWFMSLKDLERWAHSHPTHLAIFKGTFDYMNKHSFNPKLNLGHEVFIVPAGRSLLEYVNCHPQTGFLRFFEAKELPTGA